MCLDVKPHLSQSAEQKHVFRIEAGSRKMMKVQYKNRKFSQSPTQGINIEMKTGTWDVYSFPKIMKTKQVSMYTF